MLIILLGVFVSGSRTGVLSIVISSLVYCFVETSIIEKIKQSRKIQRWLMVVVVLLLAVTALLYFLKKDSANGRMLIWKISAKMVAEKPFLGHNPGGFKAYYMQYQASYFQNHPHSRYVLLADNVKNPFNEFIKVAVECGIVGVILALFGIGFILYRFIKSKNRYKAVAMSTVCALLVFACFSYPFQYVSVWLVLLFYVLLIPLDRGFALETNSLSKIIRVIIVLASIYSIGEMYQKMQREQEWKQIANQSLRGKTEQMIPKYDSLNQTNLVRNPYFLYNYGAELNVVGEYEKSIELLTGCQNKFDDYDLQLLLADNYYNLKDYEETIEHYTCASNMIPCRFVPLYQLFELYKEIGQSEKAQEMAEILLDKEVKIESVTILSIKAMAKDYLSEEYTNYE